MSELKPLTDTEKLNLALWALRGGVAWLGATVERGPAEFVAVNVPAPYADPGTIAGTHNADPWVCLKLAQEKLTHSGYSESVKPPAVDNAFTQHVRDLAALTRLLPANIPEPEISKDADDESITLEWYADKSNLLLMYCTRDKIKYVGMKDGQAANGVGELHEGIPEIALDLLRHVTTKGCK